MQLCMMAASLFLIFLGPMLRSALQEKESLKLKGRKEMLLCIIYVSSKLVGSTKVKAATV